MRNDLSSESATPFDGRAAPSAGADEAAAPLSERELADRLTAARLLGQIDEEEEETGTVAARRIGIRAKTDWSSASGGFVGGMMANLLLGFVLLLLKRAGLPIYGPGLMAMLTGALLLLLILGNWTRPVAFTLLGFLAGLVTTYAVLWLFLGPLLRSALDNASENPRAAPLEKRERRQLEKVPARGPYRATS